MTDYDDELSGTLFKNDSDNEKAPGLTGKCQIEGKTYRMAAWKRQSYSTGKPFWSIKFEDLEARPSAEDADPEGALDL